MFWKSGPNEVLHTTPLGEGNMGICNDVVKVSDAILPIPIPIPGEATTVGEAVGCHVAWPKNLIYFAPEVASKKLGITGNKPTSKKQDGGKNLESLNIKKSKPCRLAVGSINNIVAHGMMFEKIGPNELGETNMRVLIEVVKVREALLPIPIPGEVTTVGEAVGYYVAWPKTHIEIADEVASKKPSMIGNQRALKHHGVVGRGVVADERTPLKMWLLKVH